MNRITDVTRQDLIDIIESGIWVSLKEPEFDRESGEYIDGYSVKMSPYGRLNEIDFLSRIYDLDKMPSTDSRFLNARRDIWQHTINNEDWDEYWYFSDDRFHLSNGMMINIFCVLFAKCCILLFVKNKVSGNYICKNLMSCLNRTGIV